MEWARNLGWAGIVLSPILAINFTVLHFEKNEKTEKDRKRFRIALIVLGITFVSAVASTIIGYTCDSITLKRVELFILSFVGGTGLLLLVHFISCLIPENKSPGETDKQITRLFTLALLFVVSLIAWGGIELLQHYT